VVTRAAPSVEEIWRLLDGVLDPEVPALSVVELGIVREIRVDADGVTVDVTPTYSGCPAMREIERAIVGTLAAHGIEAARIRTVFSPAWTTDWISDAGREKLRTYGIAPPTRLADEGVLVPLMRRARAVPCPFCGSLVTATRSDFGSTACKSLHYCESCRQPFEHFKAI
jgi:ring-1,2-phenylacetyl-CoA epoxidase subunit PaaD